MSLNRQHTSCEARAAKLLPDIIEIYRLPLLLTLARLFKEGLLKHNNRLIVYIVNG